MRSIIPNQLSMSGGKRVLVVLGLRHVAFLLHALCALPSGSRMIPDELYQVFFIALGILLAIGVFIGHLHIWWPWNTRRKK